jgi:hypothetical protein
MIFRRLWRTRLRWCDRSFFARVFVELGALAWPNGFDLDQIALHDRMLAAGELTQVAAE